MDLNHIEAIATRLEWDAVVYQGPRLRVGTFSSHYRLYQLSLIGEHGKNRTDCLCGNAAIPAGN